MSESHPFFLKSDHIIGVFSPSSYVTEDEIGPGIKALEEAGYRVKVHPQTCARHNQAAGTSEEKCAAFHELVADPEVDIIWASAGGNRALHWIKQIDWDLVQRAGKPVIGYSDVTVLLNALYAKTGRSGWHAPMMKHMGDLDTQTLDILRTQYSVLALKEIKTITEVSDIATGPLIGGNLSAYLALAGTEYFPDMAGKILLIEDIHEELSRIDRALAQITLLPGFDGLQAIVIGAMEKLTDNSAKTFGFTLEDILKEHFGGLDIPVIYNAPFGHILPNSAIPIGAQVQLDILKKQITVPPG